MTRINLVPPAELCDQHLLAEHRELTRIPNAVAKGRFALRGQPADYVLGTGHVRFFFDKLAFLKTRYDALHAECRAASGCNTSGPMRCPTTPRCGNPMSPRRLPSPSTGRALPSACR